MKNNKTLLKKFSVWVIGILAGLLILCFVLGSISSYIIKKNQKENIISSENDYLSNNFRTYYKADFDADIFSDPDYTSLDRLIHYTYTDGQTFAIEQLDENVLNEGQRFFINYFDIVTNGKSSLYPSLFTDDYKNTPVGFEKNVERKFSPQRIYDISVTELARTDKSDTSYNYDGKTCVFGFYMVDFKILKNDGLFRRDLEENTSRPLIFELVTFDCDTKNEKTYIKNLYSQNSINQN